MKRIILLLTFTGLLLLCCAAFSQDNTEVTLIDFNDLVKNDTLPDGREENSETLIYFGGEAGLSATEELRDKMYSSLALDNWRVTLASSSKTVARQALCFTKEVKTRSGVAILGVRSKFRHTRENTNLKAGNLLSVRTEKLLKMRLMSKGQNSITKVLLKTSVF